MQGSVTCPSRAALLLKTDFININAHPCKAPRDLRYDIGIPTYLQTSSHHKNQVPCSPSKMPGYRARGFGRNYRDETYPKREHHLQAAKGAELWRSGADPIKLRMAARPLHGKLPNTVLTSR